MLEIQNAFRDKGILPPDRFDLDGKIHRFKADENDHKKSAWMVGFNNVTAKGENFIVVVGGSLKTGEQVHYQSNSAKLDKHDKKRIQEQITKAQERLKYEQEQVQQETAKEASVLWEGATGEGQHNSYLDRKHIKRSESLGVRFSKEIGGEKLLVPMRDTTGFLWGIQSISDDGSKRFMSGQRVKGCFHTIGPAIETASTIYICEGFATGATIFEATKQTVIVAFNAKNLTSVAQAIFEAHPDKAYVVCGDDDKWTVVNDEPKNTGREGAVEAANACVGKVIFPKFKDETSKPTDFNDLSVCEGIDTVRNQILEVKPEAHFIRALGHDEGYYYVYSNKNLQIQKMSSSTLGSSAGLLRLQPKAYWEALYADAKGNIKWIDAADAIMDKCHEIGIFKPDKIRGSGAWMDQGRPIFHCGDSLYYGGNYHQLNNGLRSKFMYNFDTTTARMDAEALDDETLFEFADVLQYAAWKNPENGPLLAGWLVIAPVSGALDWRPHIWITGPSGTGKSWIMENICYRLLEGFATFTQGQTTEAGIRQSQGSRSMPLIFDEFETNDQHSGERIKSILELARQASSDSSAVVLKGTSGGNAIQYRPRFSMLASSVRINLTHEEDLNRFTILELERRDKTENFHLLEKFVAKMPHDFGSRLAKKSFELLPTIVHNSRVLHKSIGSKYGMRFGQQLGAILSGLAVIVKPRVQFSEKTAEEFLSDLEDQGLFKNVAPSRDESDETGALDRILQGRMEVIDSASHSRISLVVLEVIRDTSMGIVDRSADLEREGMRVRDDSLYIIQNYGPLKKRFDGTKWSGSYSQPLGRISGVEKNVVERFKIHGSKKCLKIPLSALTSPE